MEGPHMLPAAAIKLHGVRPEERGRDRYGSISGRVRAAGCGLRRLKGVGPMFGWGVGCRCVRHMSALPLLH